MEVGDGTAGLEQILVDAGCSDADRDALLQTFDRSSQKLILRLLQDTDKTIHPELEKNRDLDHVAWTSQLMQIMQPIRVLEHEVAAMVVRAVFHGMKLLVCCLCQRYVRLRNGTSGCHGVQVME